MKEIFEVLFVAFVSCLGVSFLMFLPDLVVNRNIKEFFEEFSEAFLYLFGTSIIPIIIMCFM